MRPIMLAPRENVKSVATEDTEDKHGRHGCLAGRLGVLVLSVAYSQASSFHQPPAAHPIARRRELPQSLTAVRMTDRAGKRVRRIRTRDAGETEEPLHHFLHLILRSLAVAHDGLLHLQRGVFGDRQARA